MMTQIFKDPNAFAATFQNADPEQIRAVIAMIDGLISTGNDEVNVALEDWTTKNQTFFDDSDALKVAELADWQALGQFDLQTEKVDKWENKVTVAASNEASALALRETLSTAQTDAQADFDAQQTQHDGEVAALEGALAVIDEMRNPVAPGRRLLSKVKVNPESLDDVEDIIEDLIQQSKDALAAALAALKGAKNAHDDAKTAYTAAVAEHVKLQGELDEHKTDLTAKETAKNDAAAALEAAKNALKVSTEAEEAAAKVLADEQNRVAGENKTLNDVREMLVGLLPGGVE